MNSISFSFSRYKTPLQVKNRNNDFIVAIERSSCWAVLSIDSLKIETKIMHKGRGRFIILEDNYRGKYIGKIVDASDVIRCKF
jgi:hypothetical protein